MDTFDYGKARHQELIAEADAFRRAYQVSDNQFKQLGSFLISLGQKLKSEPTIKARPALNAK